MDAEGSFNGRVHRDATELANCGENKMLAKESGLYQAAPKFLLSPTSDEIWVPPLVWTFN